MTVNEAVARKYGTSTGTGTAQFVVCRTVREELKRGLGGLLGVFLVSGGDGGSNIQYQGSL